jgi:hypothetical protein
MCTGRPQFVRPTLLAVAGRSQARCGGVAAHPALWFVTTPAWIGLAVAGLFYFYAGRQQAQAPPPLETAAAPVPAAPRPERPLGAAVAPIELPPLDETDAVVRRLVGSLSSHPGVAAWLATDGLIRTFVVVIDNIATGHTPAKHLRALKPRIEQAYRELGQQEPFDRALERVVVALLQVPVLDGEVTRVGKTRRTSRYSQPCECSPGTVTPSARRNCSSFMKSAVSGSSKRRLTVSADAPFASAVATSLPVVLGSPGRGARPPSP